MARPRKDAHPNGDEAMTRTTIFLPVVMDQNLDVLRIQTGDAKAVLVRRAIHDLLKRHGLEPYKKPNLSVAYKETS